MSHRCLHQSSILNFGFVVVQYDAGKFFFYLINLIVSTANFAYLGLVMVVVTPNLTMGVTFGATALGSWFIFAGAQLHCSRCTLLCRLRAVNSILSAPSLFACSVSHSTWVLWQLTMVRGCGATPSRAQRRRVRCFCRLPDHAAVYAAMVEVVQLHLSTCLEHLRHRGRPSR